MNSPIALPRSSLLYLTRSGLIVNLLYYNAYDS